MKKKMMALTGINLLLEFTGKIEANLKVTYYYRA